MRRRTETGLSVSGSLAGNTPCRGAEHRVFFARVDPLPAGRRDWTGQALNKTISLHLLQQRFSAPQERCCRRQVAPTGAGSICFSHSHAVRRGAIFPRPDTTRKHFEARSARDFPQLLFPSQNTERPDQRPDLLKSLENASQIYRSSRSPEVLKTRAAPPQICGAFAPWKNLTLLEIFSKPAQPETFHSCTAKYFEACEAPCGFLEAPEERAADILQLAPAHC